MAVLAGLSSLLVAHNHHGATIINRNMARIRFIRGRAKHAFVFVVKSGRNASPLQYRDDILRSKGGRDWLGPDHAQVEALLCGKELEEQLWAVSPPKHGLTHPVRRMGSGNAGMRS
jgi:hypothetical protein